MQQALGDLNAWITGIRRDQTSTRANAKVPGASAGWFAQDQPSAQLTKTDVENYIVEHHLPAHP